jgi:DNA topoisomerase IA
MRDMKMKTILAQINSVLEELESEGLHVEADALHEIFVKLSKKKAKKKKNVPNDPALYSRCKAEIKKKFKIYPSAYANSSLVRLYKSRGGTYRTE